MCKLWSFHDDPSLIIDEQIFENQSLEVYEGEYGEKYSRKFQTMWKRFVEEVDLESWVEYQKIKMTETLC